MAYVSKGLLALHEMCTGSKVQGNNMLSEAKMKAEKLESQVDRHLGSPAEYLRYWNDRCAEDVAVSTRQIGELPARVVKRKEVSEARARGKSSRTKESIEAEEEHDESQWSRRGQLLRESNMLRNDLSNTEKRLGRTSIKDVYDNIVAWIQNDTGKSEEEVMKSEVMAYSTFGRWFGEQQQRLSTNERWRKNIAAYIDRSDDDFHRDSKRRKTA
jgi:hypothetical protein